MRVVRWCELTCSVVLLGHGQRVQIWDIERVISSLYVRFFMDTLVQGLLLSLLRLLEHALLVVVLYRLVEFVITVAARLEHRVGRQTFWSYYLFAQHAILSCCVWVMERSLVNDFHSKHLVYYITYLFICKLSVDLVSSHGSKPFPLSALVKTLVHVLFEKHLDFQFRLLW